MMIKLELLKDLHSIVPQKKLLQKLMKVVREKPLLFNFRELMMEQVQPTKLINLSKLLLSKLMPLLPNNKIEKKNGKLNIKPTLIKLLVKLKTRD
jgi:hypothetical protein